MILVLLIGIVVSVSLFSLIRPRDPTLAHNAQTEQALAQAKQALIAYASGRKTIERPGELPCPDSNNNGDAEPSCNSEVPLIGRLPWATLGLPDLRDGSGERLWYAVSSNFKNNPAVTPLNSHTLGQLSVTGSAAANQVIAIVFAPGPAIGEQSRIAGNVNTVAHYLEGENANGDTLFTTARSSSVFNDRLLAITPSLLFPVVEMRVAREARVFLNQYFSNHGFFPVAYAYGGIGSCAPATQGRIHANPSQCGGRPQLWDTDTGIGIGTSMPSWFGKNRWDEALFYAVAPACSDPAAANCSGAGGYLAVNGVENVRALVISPGTPYAGQTRPCASITDCLEAPNTLSFPAFTHVTGATTINDRVVIVAP